MGLDPYSLHAQNRAQLEKQRAEINALIDKADALLEEKGKQEKATLSDIRLLDKKMKNRGVVLENISGQLNLAEKELGQNSVLQSKLQSELDTMMRRYNALLNEAWKQQLSYNKWAFILNAKSINDSYQKWRYIQQYEAHCKESLAMIRQFQNEVHEANDKLANLVSEKRQLLQEASNQRKQLEKEQELKDELLQKVRADKAAIEQQLSQQSAKREQLNSAIEASIISALRGEENVARASSFEEMRGNLPWPVDNGQVTSGFGKQRHQHLRDVMIQNNGIDINTRIGSAAYVVHDGKVVGISEIPGFEWTVIIRHGNFYSVYSRLERVFLQEGQQVKYGDRVGMIYLDEGGSTNLHFEIWKGKEKLNPSSWLKSNI